MSRGPRRARKTMTVGGIEVPLTRNGEPDKRYRRAMRNAADAAGLPKGSKERAFAEAPLKVIDPDQIIPPLGDEGPHSDTLVVARSTLEMASTEEHDLLGDQEASIGSIGPSRKRGRGGFRDFCRRTVMSRLVRLSLIRRARIDPEFALKLAKHGFGAEPQAVQVNVDHREERKVVYVVQLPGAGAVPPAIAGLPDSSPAVDGD